MKSDVIALALSLSCLVVASPAVCQNPCSSNCGGIPVYELLDGARINAYPVKVNFVDAPGWIHPQWTTNHLAPACNAWNSGIPVPGVSYDPNSFAPNVFVAFSSDGWPFPGTRAFTAEFGIPYEWTSFKVVYVDTYNYGSANWFTGPDPPTGFGWDLRTVLTHELGHALGLGDIPDGLEGCSAMTETYSGVHRSIGYLDQAAVNCYYAPVSVGDIMSFSAWRNPQNTHEVKLKSKVGPISGSNPKVAVYVADNVLGPALLVDTLTVPASVFPDSNEWTDTFRLPLAASYYYWLDYDNGSFAPRRAPQGLFAATGAPVSVTGTSFTSFLPPTILSVTDEPFDRGGKVRLIWNAPNGYEDADAFNVYRHSYPVGDPGYDEWRVIGWLSPLAPQSYVDEYAPIGWVSEYRVSTAHHGNSVPQPGTGNTLGIWNSFSSVMAGSSIDNFGFDQITLLSNDTLVTCPAGDAGALQAEVVIWGVPLSSGPTVAIPPHMIECHSQNEFSIFCDGVPNLNADEPTDETGRTTLTSSRIGGSGETDLVFKLFSSSYVFETLTAYLKSPDESGDGVVNIIDYAAFGTSYPSPPNPYAWQRDYDGNGAINIVDWSYLVTHIGHQCSGGGLISSPLPASSDARVRVDFTETLSATEDRYLYGDVSVTNLSRFKAMLFHLRSDNPILEFVRWEDGRFGGRVMVAPIVRDGVGEIAFGVLDGEDLQDDVLALGRMVFRINLKEALNLTSRDFETRVAELLSLSGRVSRMADATMSDMVQIPRVVADALAQNRPNPFNPTTTISYSISRSGRVGLLVFGVDGKLVRTLVDRDQPPDRYEVVWDGTDNQGQRVASGVYFYQLKTPLFAANKKMILLK